MRLYNQWLNIKLSQLDNWHCGHCYRLILTMSKEEIRVYNYRCVGLTLTLKHSSNSLRIYD